MEGYEVRHFSMVELQLRGVDHNTVNTNSTYANSFLFAIFKSLLNAVDIQTIKLVIIGPWEASEAYKWIYSIEYVKKSVHNKQTTKCVSEAIHVH